MRDNPELEINRKFTDLRNRIDLRREEAKKSLDDEAMALITEIDEKGAKCKAGLTDYLEISTKTTELVKSIENDNIPLWDKDLKSFNRHVKKLKKIHIDTVTQVKQLSQANKEMKKHLFGDELAKLELKQKIFCRENSEPLA